ncbi:MAG: hypothetical protein KatS3mg118_0194 [Paracoccaceae bacterium]|nr:MAG: hypothetical protein KatS3mg118_0194 [Paracoccaceae bacterium]
MLSVISSADDPAASIAARIAGMSLSAELAVSVWQTSTARVSGAARRASSSRSGVHRRARAEIEDLDRDPRAAGPFRPQPRAKRPVASASTRSPRDRVLVSAASQAPWPFEMYSIAWCPVRATRLSPAITSRVRAMISPS